MPWRPLPPGEAVTVVATSRRHSVTVSVFAPRMSTPAVAWRGRHASVRASTACWRRRSPGDETTGALRTHGVRGAFLADSYLEREPVGSHEHCPRRVTPVAVARITSRRAHEGPCQPSPRCARQPSPTPNRHKGGSCEGAEPCRSPNRAATAARPKRRRLLRQPRPSLEPERHLTRLGPARRRSCGGAVPCGSAQPIRRGCAPEATPAASTATAFPLA